METDFCPGCGEKWVVATTGSNKHFYETKECPNGHEWAIPYTQNQIDPWIDLEWMEQLAGHR